MTLFSVLDDIHHLISWCCVMLPANDCPIPHQLLGDGQALLIFYLRTKSFQVVGFKLVKKNVILVSLLPGSPLNTTVLISFTTYLRRALHEDFLYLDIPLKCFLVLCLFAVTHFQARDLRSAYLFKYQSVSINNPSCIKFSILKIGTKNIFSAVFSLANIRKKSLTILHRE